MSRPTCWEQAGGLGGRNGSCASDLGIEKDEEMSGRVPSGPLPGWQMSSGICVSCFPFPSRHTEKKLGNQNVRSLSNGLFIFTACSPMSALTQKQGIMCVWGGSPSFRKPIPKCSVSYFFLLVPIFKIFSVCNMYSTSLSNLPSREGADPVCIGDIHTSRSRCLQHWKCLLQVHRESSDKLTGISVGDERKAQHGRHLSCRLPQAKQACWSVCPSGDRAGMRTSPIKNNTFHILVQ